MKDKNEILSKIDSIMKSHEKDWDKTITDNNGKEYHKDLLKKLLYEYSTGLEELTNGSVKYEQVLDTLSERVGKIRFGNWKENDSNVEYDGISVTNKDYRKNEGKGFGAQTCEYYEGEEGNKKFKLGIVAYNDDGAIDPIDFEDINDIRQTFFHEWTHALECYELDEKEAQKAYEIDGRKYIDAVKKEDNKYWGAGLVTREVLENGKTKMHNMITEGMVEAVAQELTEHIMDREGPKSDIRKDRYLNEVQFAKKTMDKFGKDKTIATFINNPRELTKVLESIPVKAENTTCDLMHFVGDFYADNRGDSNNPKFKGAYELAKRKEEFLNNPDIDYIKLKNLSMSRDNSSVELNDKEKEALRVYGESLKDVERYNQGIEEAYKQIEIDPNAKEIEYKYKDQCVSIGEQVSEIAKDTIYIDETEKNMDKQKDELDKKIENKNIE